MEDFFTPPNGNGSMFGITIEANQLNMNPSRTLLNTAVRNIGLRSGSMDRGCGIILKGSTSAHFHNDGKWPYLIDELKMELIGG
jgi:hypothetical protein